MDRQVNSELWAIMREALAERIEIRAEDQGQRANGKDGADSALLRGPLDQGGDEKPYTLDRGVAIIDISGTFVNRDPWFGDVTYGWAAKSVYAASADPAATAVLLKIDSPGGTVAGVTLFVDAVRAASKPVYVHTDGILASGAYWPASGARKIAASRTSQVGSIGVVTAHTDLSKMLDNHGVKISFITSGKYKAMGNFAEPLGDDAKAYIQSRIDAVYEMFAGDVAAGRGLSIDTVDTWADGQVFPAAAAMDAGLIDRVESLDAFLKFIREDNKMKIEDLKANHPETYQRVYDMGVSAANAKAEDVRKNSVSAAEEKTREADGAMVAVLFGDEAKAKFDAMVASGVTAEQLTAMKAAGLVAAEPQPAGGVENNDAASRQRILEGIQAAANPPLNPGGQTPGGHDDAARFEAMVEDYMQANGVKFGRAVMAVGQKQPAMRTAWLKSKQAAQAA